MSHLLHSTFSRVRDYLTPANNTSNFTTTGQISPEEFVTAGDYLVQKFPTWSWGTVSDLKKQANYLPGDKQYLVLKWAPCHSRLGEEFVEWNPDDEGEEGEEEVPATKFGGRGGAESRLPAMMQDSDEEEDDKDGEIPDMEEDDDDAIVRRPARGSRVPYRYYNLYLTYSNYFRVPRSYLSAYDGPTKTPLTKPTDLLSDISTDYREKTVTIEQFPFSEGPVPIQMASVHPCKHAETMKRIFEMMARRNERKVREREKEERGEEEEEEEEDEGEGWEEVSAAIEGEEKKEEDMRVDQYMVVFVKFLAGVIPGVEMDYTMGM